MGYLNPSDRWYIYKQQTTRERGAFFHRLGWVSEMAEGELHGIDLSDERLLSRNELLP